jgi:hypothetical protein
VPPNGPIDAGRGYDARVHAHPESGRGTLTTLGIEDLLTERPTLAIPRLCHNAQADLLRKQQVLGSNPSVGSIPSFVPGKSRRPELARFSRRSEPDRNPANRRGTTNWTDSRSRRRCSCSGWSRPANQANPWRAPEHWLSLTRQVFPLGDDRVSGGQVTAEANIDAIRRRRG